MTVFVLGPSEWRGRSNIDEAPLISHVPTEWPLDKNGRFRPGDIRAAIVGLCNENGISATMMEMHSRRPDENHLGLFLRIEREMAVDRHSVIWPRDCKRAGLDIEIGNLLSRCEYGELLDLRIFVQQGAAEIERGIFVSMEHGQRTRYYEDLSAHASTIIFWDGYSELLMACLHHARPF